MEKRRLRYRIAKHNRRAPLVAFSRHLGKLALYVVRITLIVSAISSVFFLPDAYGRIGYAYAVIAIVAAWILAAFSATPEERTEERPF